MELEDLAKLIRDKHQETQSDISELGDKVEELKINQSVIQSKLSDNVMTKVGFMEAQDKCKNEVYAAIRKASMWNKIGAALAAAASALAGYLFLKGKH